MNRFIFTPEGMDMVVAIIDPDGSLSRNPPTSGDAFEGLRTLERVSEHFLRVSRARAFRRTEEDKYEAFLVAHFLLWVKEYIKDKVN
jgi:hypothetical protein